MTKLETLDRVAHQHLRIQEDKSFSVCSTLNMCAVVLSEIPRLVLQYPLVFTMNGETGQLICVALFGFDQNQNLYWEADRWSGNLLPLNIGRQPFFVRAVDQQSAETAPSLVTCIDVDSSGVGSSEGEALFDSSGKESPYLRYKLAILSELLDGELKTRAFVDKLSELNLITPIQLELKSPAGSPRKLSGLQSIDEKKLRSLEPGALTELNTSGYLHAAYAMLSSLGHIQILARKVARAAT